MALIIAIGFLAILSIIGAVVLDIATRDISSSGVMTRYARHSTRQTALLSIHEPRNPDQHLPLRLPQSLDDRHHQWRHSPQKYHQFSQCDRWTIDSGR